MELDSKSTSSGSVCPHYKAASPSGPWAYHPPWAASPCSVERSW